MIEFNKAKDRHSSISFSFEIDEKTDELQMESEEYTNNGLYIERHMFNISKKEAKTLVEYLSEWINDKI